MAKIELEEGSPEYKTIFNMMGKLAAIEIVAKAAIAKYPNHYGLNKCCKRILDIIDHFPSGDGNNDTETKRTPTR